jgi:hypothetical protein
VYEGSRHYSIKMHVPSQDSVRDMYMFVRVPVTILKMYVPSQDSVRVMYMCMRVSATVLLSCLCQARTMFGSCICV